MEKNKTIFERKIGLIIGSLAVLIPLVIAMIFGGMAVIVPLAIILGFSVILWGLLILLFYL